MRPGLFRRLDTLEAAALVSQTTPLVNHGEHIDRAEMAFMAALGDTVSVASLAAAEAAYAGAVREYGHAG